MNGDAVTVLRTVDGSPANKSFRRGPDAKLIKEKALERGSYHARIEPGRDLAALAELRAGPLEAAATSDTDRVA